MIIKIKKIKIKIKINGLWFSGDIWTLVLQNFPSIRKLNAAPALRYGSKKARTIFANRNVFLTFNEG